MLIPESSDLYSYTTEVVNATGPRFRGSVVLEKPSDNAEDYQLKIAYRIYKRKNPIESGKKVNLFLIHGNGMTKAIWHYHVDKFYQMIPNLNCVIAPDTVNHGHSAVLNKGKLGHEINWLDYAKDVIKITKVDEKDVFLQPNVTNVVLGHSMAGQMALIIAYLEPTLFDAVISLNPVAHVDEKRYRHLNMAFNMWNKRKMVYNKYPVKDGEDFKDAIIKCYKKHGFYKKFDDTILKNMLEDDFDPNQNPQDGYIESITEPLQEYYIYFSGTPTILRSYPIYQKITTPVYHIVGDKDHVGENATEELRNELRRVVHPVDIKGQHLVHAEQPDYFIGVIKNIMDEIIEDSEKNGDIRFEDFDHLKTYGINYKTDLQKIAMENGLRLIPFSKL